MISKKHFRLKKNGEPNCECFCIDFTKIENYSKAALDSTQVWECHHRLETHYKKGGKWVRRDEDLTPEQLKAEGMYYDVSPEELIFLTHEEHFNPKLWHKKPEGAGTQPKKVLCVETGKIFESISEAERETGIPNTHISSVCNRKKSHKTAGGFHWQYYTTHPDS